MIPDTEISSKTDIETVFVAHYICLLKWPILVLLFQTSNQPMEYECTYLKIILICFCFRLLSCTQNYFKHVQSQGYNEVNDSRTIEKCGKKIT